MKADVEYADYPYSKFNTKIEAVTYTDEEYETLLKSSTWTRSETDHLMFLCLKYDLRWPVIVDRYSLLPPRTTEELQERYYGIVTAVKINSASASESQARNEAFTSFDVEYQKMRRCQQEYNYRK